MMPNAALFCEYIVQYASGQHRLVDFRVGQRWLIQPVLDFQAGNTPKLVNG
jgi:hypothetical protein